MYVYKLLIKWGFRKNLILFTKNSPQTSKTAAYKVCQNVHTNPKMIKFLEKEMISKPDTFYQVISAYFLLSSMQ